MASLKYKRGAYDSGRFGMKLPVSKRIVLALLVVVIIAVGVAAYSLTTGTQTSTQTQTSVGTPTTLIMGTTDSIVGMDPAVHWTYFDGVIEGHSYDTLVEYAYGTTNLVPSLATSWDASPDGKVWTFHLRNDVSFQDGTPLNATAVKFSIDRVNAIGAGPSYYSSVVDNVQVIDTYTVQITLKYAFAPFLSYLSYTTFDIVNPNVVAKYGNDNMTYLATHTAGSGRYNVVNYIKGERVELQANQNYWKTKPKTDRVIIIFYSDSAAMTLALQSGEIDFAFRAFTPSDLKTLEGNSKLKVWAGPESSMRFLFMNVKTPPFDNVLVRRAMAYAVDRDAINAQVFGNTVVPLFSMEPAGFWSYTPAFQKYQRNVTMAKELLKQAGYPNGFTMDLYYTPTHYGSTESFVAQLLQTEFQDIGLTVNLKSAEWATYSDLYYKGAITVGLLGWYPPVADPDDPLSFHAYSQSAVYAGSYYNSSEADQLVLQGRETTDQTQRTAIYENLQNLLANDVPYVPLWQTQKIFVAYTYVNGFAPWVNGPIPGYHPFLDALWKESATTESTT